MILIAQGVFMAIALVALMLPPMFIYNPTRDGGNPFAPPPNSAVIKSVPREVKQKLYVLFVLPGIVAFLALFLYVIYYRTIRLTQAMVEQQIRRERQKQFCGMQQLTAREGGSHLFTSSYSMFQKSQGYWGDTQFTSTVPLPMAGVAAPGSSHNMEIDRYPWLSLFACAEVQEFQETVEKKILKPLEAESGAFLDAVNERLTGGIGSALVQE